MPDPSHLSVFVLASLVMAFTPGPNVLYILTRGIGQGRRAAVASALGVETGTLVHITATAAGLAAVLAASATAFAALKYAGAAYLVYLGVRTMRGSGALLAARDDTATASLPRAFGQGFVVNVLNPKVALFFLAFLPQFTDPARGPVALQIVILGLLYLTMGTLADLTYALSSGAAGAWLTRRPGVARYQHMFSGAMYCALGAITAFTGGDHRR